MFKNCNISEKNTEDGDVNLEKQRQETEQKDYLKLNLNIFKTFLKTTLQTLN